MTGDFMPQAGLVPFHPDAKGLTIDVGMVKVVYVWNSSLYVMVYIINNIVILCLYNLLATPNGILAVNYLDANHDDFGISYQILNTSNDTIQNSVTYRTITGSINWLRSK